jgi:hypothetical protein
MAAQEGDNIRVILDGNGAMTTGHQAQALSEHQLQEVFNTNARPDYSSNSH